MFTHFWKGCSLALDEMASPNLGLLFRPSTDILAVLPWSNRPLKIGTGGVVSHAIGRSYLILLYFVSYTGKYNALRRRKHVSHVLYTAAYV